MLIALTHNLQLDSRDEDEAEFDRPETIAFLVEQLRALGHEVEAIEVDEHELRALVRRIVTRYGQPALVEAYLPGREFTVGLLGEKRPRVLPAMEIVFTDHSVSHPVYSYGHKKETEAGSASRSRPRSTTRSAASSPGSRGGPSRRSAAATSPASICASTP